MIRLVNKEYTEAEELFLRALGQPGGEEDPENWLGLMMSSLNIPGREALGAYAFPIDENEYFQKALACASEEKSRSSGKSRITAGRTRPGLKRQKIREGSARARSGR